MSDREQKVHIDIEIEVVEELQIPEKDFKKDLEKIILTDKQKLKDSETS